MNKKLFNQIKNEWHSNLWLIAELLLVSVVMWFIVDYIYVRVSVYMQPRGFDIAHCYKIDMGTLVPKDDDYVPGDTVQCNDVEELMLRLKRRPDIEAVSLSYNSYPYNRSNSDMPLKYGKMKHEGVYIRAATPEFIRVFRYEGARGETPEQLSKMLTEKGFIASNDIFKEKYGIDLTSLIGRKFFMQGDTVNLYTLLATYKPVRYSDNHEPFNSCSMLVELSRNEYGIHGELCVRAKTDQDVGFKERLWKDADKQLRVGNVYISNIESFDDIRKNYQRYDTNQMRNYLTGMGFLMFNIFLGLLGTFWFRTQQRRSEIALFKALGATNRNVFGRQIMEGLLLLSIAMIPAIIIDWNIAFAGLNQQMNGLNLNIGRFTLTVLITWLLIAIMIVLGNWLPAKKAMSIQPARALHEE